MKEENPYKILVDTFGEDVQFQFAIEEMAELTKAICKYKRKAQNCTGEDKEKLVADLIEEIADVQICAEQLAFMFGQEKVEQEKEFKLNRALKRAEKKNNEERL